MSRTPHRLSLAEKLDLRSMPEPNSGCVLWTGCAFATGYGTQVDIAKRFDIAQTTVSDIKRRERWAHIPEGGVLSQ